MFEMIQFAIVHLVLCVRLSRYYKYREIIIAIFKILLIKTSIV